MTHDRMLASIPGYRFKKCIFLPNVSISCSEFGVVGTVKSKRSLKSMHNFAFLA